MSSLAWKFRRLSAMGGPEIIHRIHRAVGARLERIAPIRALPVPRETFGMPWADSPAPAIEPGPYVAEAEKILAGRFTVFELEEACLGFPPQWDREPKTGMALPLAHGKTLDYRDRSRYGDIRYLWEFNRHLELVTLAQAFGMTDEIRYASACRRLVESWIGQCPYTKGPNWVSALEHAVRLTNWSVTWHLLGGAHSRLFEGEAGANFRRLWLGAIYRHCTFIAGHFSLHSSANNHLFGECMGLFIGSVTWPCWPESEHWRKLAQSGLETEAIRQIGPDGVNREQAFWYHHEVADMMLLAGLFGRANGFEFSQDYWQRLLKMLEFVAAMMDVAGNVPMIGDADDAVMVRFSRERNFNVYRSLLATGAVLFDRRDFAAKARRFDDKSRWLLGDAGAMRFEALLAAPQTSRDGDDLAFREGGYYVLGKALDTPGEIRLIADAGPVGYLSIAAHGHADALAFTLSAGGHEILIDPGTYAYLGDAAWRSYFRGTSAHNTVVVDGADQSQSGGPFIWLRKASAKVLEFRPGPGIAHLRMEHDGYARLQQPVIHRREIAFDKNASTIQVTDRLTGRGEHAYEWFWHFAENVAVSLEPGRVIANVPGWRIEMAVPDECDAPVLLRGSDSPRAGWISRRFGRKAPCTTVCWKLVCKGEASVRTCISVFPEQAHA